MKWDEMTPRERDALVAEKVMNYTIIVDGWTDEHGDDYGATPSSGLQAVFPLACYTTDISAAWEIVAKMNEAWFVKVERISNRVGPNVGWYCEVGGFDASAAVASEAICLAALRAVGVDV